VDPPTRSVVGEALAIVVVLGVTAVLVNITPPKNAAASETTSSVQTKPVGDAAAEVALIPAQVGNNSVHITYVDADERPVDIAQSVTVELTNPEQGIGPISRDGAKAATGHFIIDGLQIPTSGKWTLTLVTRISDFKQERTEFTYDVSS
jgi:copper transport protein